MTMGQKLQLFAPTLFMKQGGTRSHQNGTKTASFVLLSFWNKVTKIAAFVLPFLEQGGT